MIKELWMLNNFSSWQDKYLNFGEYYLNKLKVINMQSVNKSKIQSWQ